MILRKPALILLLLLFVAGGSVAMAGAKLKINDDAELDLGIRIQALALSSDRDVDNVLGLDTGNDFIVRRARLRLGAKIGKHVNAFLQTERGVSVLEGTLGGYDMRIIDAFVNVKYNNWAQFILGLNMSPASRQNLTSSGALMAADRPGLAYKTLTWGTRALTRIATATAGDAGGGTASGLLPGFAVRDTGLTFFGSGDIGESLHIKYYVGAYDGIQNGGITGTSDERTGTDDERYTARVQVNLWDAEPGYFNSSTYLGKKRTLAIGASFDQQGSVTRSEITGNIVDYEFTTLDVLLELPFGDEGRTALTAEAAWMMLDLGDDIQYLNSQGDGGYLQAGFLIGKWQPWILYETWSSDAPSIAQGNVSGAAGTFDQYRVGISYFLMGHNANIKLAYENYEPELPINAAGDDSISTVLLGFYITY